jgi:predicted ATPase with chaperone activity
VAKKLVDSAGACDWVRNLACTKANLAGADDIAAEHIAEAISYRKLDRKL